MLNLKIGLTLFLLTIVPTSYITQILSRGMYGPIFKQFPPAVFISFNLVMNIVVAFIIASVFINKADLYNRLPRPIPGQNLLFIGGAIILLPQLLRVFTSMIQGGGASYALMHLAGPFVLVAKIVLYIGVIKLLMAVKPSEDYVYQ